MATLLYRLGRAAFRRRRAVLAAWLVVFAGLIAGVGVAGQSLNDQFTIPGSSSQQALDTLSTVFPTFSGAAAQIVFVAPDGKKVTDPAVAAAIKQTVAAAAKAPQVAAAVDPFTARTVSADGRTALAQVNYSVKRAELNDGSLDALEATGGTARAAGLRVEFGGNAFGITGVQVGATELIGVVVALLVLVITFAALLPAAIPLLTALVGVGTGLTALLVLSHVITLSSTAPTLALMIGLAVGIDYALFILSRHRSQLAVGMPAEESAAVATATAGSAVVFAGITVIIALVGLAVARIPFLTVMGVGAAGTVLVAVCVAVTLLPAVLGFAGDRLAPRPGSRAARRAQASESAAVPDAAAVNGGERWVRLVTRMPVVTILLVIAGLGILAVPARDLQLALPDNGSANPGSTQREAYDLVSGAFGPGFNGPLLVVVQPGGTARGPAATAVAAQVATSLSKVADVVAVSAPQLAPDGRTSVLQLVPGTGPDSKQTKDLVSAIRDRVPALNTQTGATVSVTGATAVAIDVSDRLRGSLLPFAAVVVGLALILLLMVFRSIVVPIKASVGFLLSIAASFGAVVAVFQWGWLAGPLGVHTTGPVVSFMPIILMAVLFGLAMDYEVFLVSRIREEYVHTGHPYRAVVSGARHASRVVTAAALIMFSVFASFVTADDTTIKPIAFALAFGVLVDAFLVRMTLVPAVLALLGRASWWLPGWLNRLLPNLDIEGERLRGRRPTAQVVIEPTERTIGDLVK